MIESEIFNAFLLKLDSIEEDAVAIEHFQQFLMSLNLSTKIYTLNQNIHITLQSQTVNLSLIWSPRTHYYPNKIEFIEESLTGIKFTTYQHIWMASNALCDKLWRLTPLHKSILELLCKGHYIEEIAQQCGLSPPSIKRHLKLIRESLSANNNAHAVAIALRHKWI